MPDNENTPSKSESENPAIPSPTPKRARPRTNQDWWPNQMDLSVLHHHSHLSNPMEDDFNYAEEFKTLDLDALLSEDSTFYGDLFAHVVEWQGTLYLEDGLHRALRAALQQRPVLHARVLVIEG